MAQCRREFSVLGWKSPSPRPSPREERGEGENAHAEFPRQTLFFVSILIFSLQHLLPGDPALVMAGEERDPEVIAHIRAQYRLDQPIPVQYIYWLKGVAAGDFGESLRIKMPVREL